MTWRAQLPLLRRLLIAGFLLVAAGLLWRHARTIEWHEVAAAIAGYPPSRIALARPMGAIALLADRDQEHRAHGALLRPEESPLGGRTTRSDLS